MQKADYSKFKAQFDYAVRQASRILITSHTSPDDDSVASVLSTYYYLTEILKLSCPVEMVYEGDYKNDRRYGYFLNYDKVQFVDDLLAKIGTDALVIMVDVAKFDLCLTARSDLGLLPFRSIQIDHHTVPAQVQTDLYFNADLSSLSETVLRLFYENSDALIKPIAEIFLLGILGDTGMFAYVTRDQTDVFDVVKSLIKITGESIDQLQSKYDTISIGQMNVYQRCLSHCAIEHLEGYPDYLYSYITRADLEGFTTADIESARKMFKVILKKIAGAGWGFFIDVINENDYYISFRSVPGCINVRKIAEAMPIGGGHDLSAGATILSDHASSIAEAKEFVLNYMRTHEAPRHIPAHNFTSTHRSRLN